MRWLIEFARKHPVIGTPLRALRRSYEQYALGSKTAEQVFTDIYNNNGWNGSVSVSGSGSDNRQTEKIAEHLPVLLEEFQIKTMLDIPCGDFHWMKSVKLQDVAYTGADIVEGLTRNNNKEYQNDNVNFVTLDLINGQLPKVDLVFCRDCLVHLSFSDISAALRNLCDSQSTYLLTTTFTERKQNHDIATGQWRTLNLEAPPFEFPAPLKLIDEHCTEAAGKFADKALGLWKMSDIRNFLEETSDPRVTGTQPS